MPYLLDKLNITIKTYEDLVKPKLKKSQVECWEWKQKKRWKYYCNNCNKYSNSLYCCLLIRPSSS